MKEMLGGCCVCSDESGWAENPLVYCDGQGCTVAVHQACYGIVTVPTGPWYCRKCESTERSARVRCELCPSRDGALKRTEQEGWAHVVCALYIPEVRFRNVTTMEPILLDLIPSERFGKTCYICEEQGREARATVGACMQCNKAGCRQQFHVTCAQALGLLCEEAGNFLDNVKYCGYCQHHYSKLKKSNNVKTIPPYKPIPADSGSSDSSAEKEAEAPTKPSGNSGKRRGSNTKASASASKSKSNPSPNFEVNGALEERGAGSGRNTPKDNVPAKFTTSNFVETIVTQSESVFGTDVKPGTITKAPSGPKATTAAPSNKSNHSGKKRKAGARTPTVPGNDNSNQSASSEASGPVLAGPTPAPPAGDGGDSQLTVTEASSVNVSDQDKNRKPKAEGLATQNRTNTVETGSTPVIMSTSQSQPVVAQSPSTTANSIVVSVPLTATSLPSNVQNVTTPALYQQLQQCSINTAPAMDNKPHSTQKFPHEDNVSKRARFQNGVGAPHMLGNQLNPSSTMAQKMSDTLSQELEAHSIFTEASNSSNNLVGPQLHSRVIASVKSNQPFSHSTSFANVFSGNSFSNMSNSSGLNSGAIPQTLEQLLERQWEQGSQFLMDQAQHFDIASLLSCLHQLKAENVTLEERVNTLVQRRDHLLAVNARLAIPLTSTSSTHQVNNIHPNVNPSSHPNISHADVQQSATMSRVNRDSRVNNSYMGHPSSSAHPAMENGLSPDPSPPASAASMQYQHRGSLIATQSNATIRHSPASSAYHQGQSSNIITPATANSTGVVRNSSATPDPSRGVQR